MPTSAELFDFSQFDLNAILRGVQLTFVGAQRALQNPKLWTTQHYRQAAIAVGCGIAIRLLIEIPIIAVKVFLWFLSFVVRLDTVTWDDRIGDGLRFLQEYVLQVPLFLMTLMRHVTPAMDDLFMLSLQWVDYTYAAKHVHDNGGDRNIDPRTRYYENLCSYAQLSGKLKTGEGGGSGSGGGSSKRFLWRFARKALLSLGVFALSFVPVVGRLVLPAVSFYTLRRAVGLGPAALIFGLGVFLPRRYLVVFLQTYFGSRSLMRELLGPYFARVRLSADQKRRWFQSRQALLFGFGAGFYVLLRVPLVGVLVYGIAEASTAYLVTKITDPPPPLAAFGGGSGSGSSSGWIPSMGQGKESSTAATAAATTTAKEFIKSQQQWHNKKAFLELALDNLDALRSAPAPGSLTDSPDRPSSLQRPLQQQLQQDRPTLPGQFDDPDRPSPGFSDEPPPAYTETAGR